MTSEANINKTRGISLGILFLLAIILFAVGLNTQVFLGDEVHHYRFAKETYELGHRAVYDTLYGPVIPPGYLYSTEPLWPLGLAMFWKITGGFSHFSAQLYHTLFFIFFLTAVFFLARDLYGERCAWHASFVAATVPMVTAFGILFYIDLPAAALSALLFLLLYRKQYFLSGVILGLLYLTKRSGAFFIPALFLLILLDSSLSFFKKIKAFAFCFTASFLIVLPDILWRHRHFFAPAAKTETSEGVSFAASSAPSFASSFGSSFASSFGVPTAAQMASFSHSLHTAIHQGLALFREKIGTFTSWRFWEIKEYLNSSLLRPKDVVSYFGVSFLVLFLFYFFKRQYHFKDRFLWIPVAVYMAVFAFIFHLASDIRYLFPILPMLVILAGKSLETLKTGWYKQALLVICFLQFILVSLFVYDARQPSRELKEGFSFIRSNIPEQAVIMYPEGNLLEGAQRKVLWGLGGILNILWAQEENKILPLIKQNHLGYIIVKKNRVYKDDQGKIQHHGGYPQSFVDRLPQFSFTKQIFENSEISIWQIDPKLTA